MIVIAGWIDVEESVRAELVEASVPLQDSTRREEPGCSAYVFTVDPVVPGRVHVYEAWETAEDLDAHFRHRNYFAMREVLRGYPRLGGSIAKYRVDATDPVYGDDGVASATFWSVAV